MQETRVQSLGWEVPLEKGMAIYSNIQMVKESACSVETQIRSLGLEDPLEKEMATHSSILAWKIPGTEEPGRLQSIGLQRVGHDRACVHVQSKE